VIQGRKAFAEIAHLIGIDRPQFESLLVDGVHVAITDDQLPAFVLVRDDDSVVMPPAGVHPSRVLRDWRASHHAKHLVVLRELALPDMRHYAAADRDRRELAAVPEPVDRLFADIEVGRGLLLAQVFAGRHRAATVGT
jgi:hypothetical protein